VSGISLVPSQISKIPTTEVSAMVWSIELCKKKVIYVTARSYNAAIAAISGGNHDILRIRGRDFTSSRSNFKSSQSSIIIQGMVFRTVKKKWNICARKLIKKNHSDDFWRELRPFVFGFAVIYSLPVEF